MSFSNCDLWSLQKQYSQKLEKSYLNHKVKSASLVLSKIRFHRRYIQSRNFHKFFFLEKVLLSNCDLWSLQKRHSQKQNNQRYLSQNQKSTFTGAPENTFSRKVDTHLKLERQFFFENVSFSNCDLRYLQKHHSQKEQNLSYLSHEEKRTSLILLKILFYVR